MLLKSNEKQQIKKDSNNREDNFPIAPATKANQKTSFWPNHTKGTSPDIVEIMVRKISKERVNKLRIISAKITTNFSVCYLNSLIIY